MADAKKSRKWVKGRQRRFRHQGARSPAFPSHDGAKRRSTLYDHKKAK